MCEKKNRMLRVYPSASSAPPSKSVSRKTRPVPEDKDTRPANAPATMEVLPSTDDTRKLREVPLAARFSAGRKLPRLLQLMQMHPFRSPSHGRTATAMQPARGLFTTVWGRPASIVSTFRTRRQMISSQMHCPLPANLTRFGRKRSCLETPTSRSMPT